MAGAVYDLPHDRIIFAEFFLEKAGKDTAVIYRAVFCRNFTDLL